MYSRKKCKNCGEIVEGHGACPKAVNDSKIRCGHFKHDLYWGIVKEKSIPCADPIASNPDNWYSDRSKLYVDDFIIIMLLLEKGINTFSIFE